MMANLSKPLTFTSVLSASAHRRAEQFRRKHSNPEKAKQVYLNTLAVFAVNFYLRCMGIETDWDTSESANLAMQCLLDVADLNVKNLGKLECRPVLPNDKIVHIPPDVWSDRMGYIAVQFDESLTQGTLLGFTETAGNGEIAVSQLRSLEEFLAHLNQIRQSQLVEASVNLSQWFEDIFAAGWQSLVSILGTQPENLAFTFRSSSSVNKTSIRRAKLINLGLNLGNKSVALLAAISQEAAQEVGILIQVHPVEGETYLPSNLKLSLLSQSGGILQEVESRSQDNYIQLKRFRGMPGEGFKIQVACGNVTMTETFVI